MNLSDIGEVLNKTPINILAYNVENAIFFPFYWDTKDIQNIHVIIWQANRKK
jgi:hypothetical protein